MSLCLVLEGGKVEGGPYPWFNHRRKKKGAIRLPFTFSVKRICGIVAPKRLN